MKKLSPVLLVDELEPAIAFYRDVLGFEVKMVMAVEGFAQLESGAVEVMLEGREAMAKDFPSLADAPAGGSTVLYIETENVDSLRRQVEGKTKVTIDLRDQPYGMREFVLRDPSGNLLTLASPIPQATAAGAAQEATA
ncbi:MAG: VOC family protein [Candidatus Dormiibacterota bacterium]